MTTEIIVLSSSAVLQLRTSKAGCIPADDRVRMTAYYEPLPFPAPDGLACRLVRTSSIIC